MTAPALPASKRITQLDALRGLAVIGIVWMNVYVFALPAQGYYNPTAWSGSAVGEMGPSDRLVWTASFVFIEDKFRTLFAMLFGAGCLILIEKAQASGAARVWRAHFARMAVLFVIGFAHALLLASNDILRGYALAGCALPLLTRLNPRALIAIAVGLIVLHLGGGIIAFGKAMLDWSRGFQGSDLVMLAQRNFGVEAWAIELSLEQGKESLGDRIGRRLDGVPAQLQTVAGSVPINLAAMALGMALWKTRMLAAEWRTFRLQRLAAVCALVSVPALFAMAAWVSQAGFPGVYVGPASLVFSAPFDTALGVAYAATGMAFLTAGGRVSRLLASVGRLSLTNYFMTSVVLSAVFAHWGLGLFGTVSRAEALAISFVPITAMLIVSPIWTARFGQGPMERLWRRLSRLLA